MCSRLARQQTWGPAEPLSLPWFRFRRSPDLRGQCSLGNPGSCVAWTLLPAGPLLRDISPVTSDQRNLILSCSYAARPSFIFSSHTNPLFGPPLSLPSPFTPVPTACRGSGWGPVLGRVIPYSQPRALQTRNLRETPRPISVSAPIPSCPLSYHWDGKLMRQG